VPFKYNEINKNSNGGTELVSRGLEARLREQRPDLLDHFDFYPSRVREFDPNRQSIYILHDLPGDPESEHLRRDKGERFDAMVFVSDWQHQQYMQAYGLGGENCYVLRNAIEPFPEEAFDKWNSWTTPIGSQDNPIRLIYHTTPHRGLEILLPVFQSIQPKLLSQGIYVTLDVYSSFSIYGWTERDQPYSTLFSQCREHPAITYHGAVSNDEVREALTKAHVFAFPSIWPETSCIALIEAMSAGCVAVHSNLAALPETSGGLTVGYRYIRDKSYHAGRFKGMLENVCIDIHKYQGDGFPIAMARERANQLYGWKHRISEWVSLLESLKN
jgi:UDP-glucose:(glucosyl)LPS alpha-1,2-glucosyltransferase